MPAQDMPAAEVDIDEHLVRALLEDQHPDLAGLALAHAAFGWDNVIYRLGEHLCVRVPRRQMAAELFDSELRWLPLLAPRLPLPVPAPIRVGRPALGYPWSWSVCPWFEGDVATDQPPTDWHAAAEQLGEFVGRLHQPAPPEAPRSPYRGGPLGEREPAMRERAGLLGDLVDSTKLLEHFDRALATPRHGGPPVWLHGDLHPANIIVADGRVAAVIDFGDLCAGDPANDLALAWLLFPPEVRGRFRAAAGNPDDATWRRAHGWAVYFGVTYLAHSADNPRFQRLGHQVIAAVLEDVPRP